LVIDAVRDNISRVHANPLARISSVKSLHRMNNATRLSNANILARDRKDLGRCLRSGAQSAPALGMPFLSILAGIALVLCPAIARAAGCPDQPVAIEEDKVTLGRQHHPIGRPLPQTPQFNQPDRCAETIWFFDENGNGAPDPGEVRLFGIKRQVDCGSCHGESTQPRSAAAASVFLRQDAATLCLVCHGL
jgi:predicted CXXCH cytochrome family protein